MPTEKGPDRFQHERGLLASGLDSLAGVDEVGRGPLAGPVVAAAVIFPAGWIREGLPEVWRGLNDSKQLTPARREAYFEWIVSTPAIRYAVARVESEEIDRINILRATHRAMVQALDALPHPPAHVLVDGLRVDAIRWPQTPLVKGDSLSYSIAAASVLAKVTRDRWMKEADLRWPGYGFGIHKGYPTAQHLRALSELGPCPIHRRSFGPVGEAMRQMSLFG